MSDPVTGTAAIGAALVYCTKTAYEYVLKSKNGTSDEHKRCKALEVQGEMQASMDAQTRLLEEIKQNSKDTRDGVIKLVTISEQRHP